MRSLFRFPLAALAAATVLGPAAAQEASSWRDPEQGCWYLMTPQGGIGLRYRRDGSPDCPDSRTASLPSAPTLARPTLLPAGTALATAPASPASRSSVPYDYPASRPALTWSGSSALRDAPAVATAPPRALTWPSAPPAERPDIPASLPSGQVAGRSMTCFPGEGVGAERLAVQRVNVDLRSQALVVEASSDGVARTERYTIDTNMDAWLGGRNQRDPRLGFVFTQSRGQLRLDWPEGGSLRAPVRSYSFRCQGEGGLT